VQIQLPYVPRDWQKSCHRLMRRFNVFVLHRRAGKTELAIMQLINAALKCEKELGAFAYIAPLLKQAKRVVWRRIKHRLRQMIQHGMCEINESELMITFTHNEASISLYGADNPDALRGIYLDGVVLDEVAQMAPEVWDEVVRPTLADRRGWAIFIGTVKSVDLFYDVYMRGLNLQASGRGEWCVQSFTCHETNAIDADEVESMQEEMSENAFEREMLNNWDVRGDDQLLSVVDIREAMARSYKPGELDHAPRILGVDPARFGNDRAVIVRRQGLQVFDPIVKHGQDNMRLARIVAQEIDQWKPDAVFIDAGAGAGVIDRLRQLGHGHIIEVPFGSAANDDKQFVNHRTEMWWKMREWIVSGGALPNNEKMRMEMATPTYSYDAKERKVLESKDQIKKRLPKSGSPDLADAVAVTFSSVVEGNEDDVEHALPQVFDVPPSGRRRGGYAAHNPYGALRKLRNGGR
jgi:hypothetical protein